MEYRNENRQNFQSRRLVYIEKYKYADPFMGNKLLISIRNTIDII